MAKLAFSVGPQGGALKGEAKAEFESVVRQADAGYARTVNRKRSKIAIAADAHRAFIAPLITADFRHTKQAIFDIADKLKAQFGGAWKYDRTRELIRSLKDPPPREPRPATDPNNYEDTGDE